MKKLFLLILLLLLTVVNNPILKAQNLNWTVYNTSNSGLPDNDLMCLAMDGNGNIWVGTYAGGLVKYDGTNWIVYDTSNSGLPDNYVECIALDESGNKWIGTGGLVKYDDTNWTVYNTSNSGLPDNWIHCLAIDESGNIWVGTDVGLAKYDGTDWTVYNTSNSILPDDGIACLTIDRSGAIWIGAGTSHGGGRINHSGLLKYDSTNPEGTGWTVYNNFNYHVNYMRCIATDGKGNIWIGTSGTGLAKYDGVNWTVYDTSNSGLPDNYVDCIALDENGNKWIGTGNGLVKCDGTNWTVYDTSNSGLPSNSIGSLAIDGSGNIWIGTWGGGLAVFNEGGIVSVKELENKNGNYPDKFILNQNYPNPFNPTTKIEYSIFKKSHVTLKVFDILGTEIKTLVNEEKPAGNYHIEFNAANLSSGVYFYRIQAGSFNQVRKMLLIK